jgi:sortase A
MEWVDYALSAFMKEPVAKPDLDRIQTNAPAMAGHGLVPTARPLPTGALIGRMEIPDIGMSVMVMEGDNESVLGKAVGHVPATAFPGGAGNVVVAGHRDTFFRALRNIQKDDEITFTTTEGTYHYQVESIDKVGPQDVQVLQKSSRPTLTLITCYPFYYVGPAPKRFIVRAWKTPSTPMGEPNQTLANAPTRWDSHF